MTLPSLSYAELEALHDVLEAARCYWYSKPESHTHATNALRLVHQLYWRIGEELPKTGAPSSRFLPIEHPEDGSIVNQIINIALALSGEYSTANDPWFADTVVMSSQVPSELPHEQLSDLKESLQRLGLILEFEDGLEIGHISVERRNTEPR